MKKYSPSMFSVLIADEEVAVYKELMDCVDSNGMIKLTHCKTVNELMDWCETESIPDLVLLDAGFGEGKAYTIATYLKMKYKPQPVIVAMPYFGMTPITMAVLSGCDEVICKPTHLEVLMALLYRWNNSRNDKTEVFNKL